MTAKIIVTLFIIMATVMGFKTFTFLFRLVPLAFVILAWAVPSYLICKLPDYIDKWKGGG